MKTTNKLMTAAALAALSLSNCSKEPAPAPVADEYVHEEVAQLKQQLKEFEAWVKTPNTAGLETADLGRQMIQMREEIKALKGQIAALPKTAAAPASDGTSGSSGSSSSASSTASVVPADASDYTPQQIADFRKILDVAEKQKREEQAAERIETQLTRIGVELTPDQKKAVTALTLALQQKQGEVVRGGFGTSDTDRKATNEKIQALRTQYETDLRSIVPTALADKIVEGMGRGFPGFAPRRIDGTSRNGMSDN